MSLKSCRHGEDLKKFLAQEPPESAPQSLNRKDSLLQKREDDTNLQAMTRVALIAVLVVVLICGTILVRWFFARGLRYNLAKNPATWESLSVLHSDEKSFDDDAIRKLVEQLLDWNESVVVANKLAAIGKRAEQPLLAALKDPRFQTPTPIRGQPDQYFLPLVPVTKVIGRLLLESAIQPLTELLNSQNANLRHEVAFALAHIATDECIDAVKRALADPQPRVRSGAVIGIQRSIREHRSSQKFLQSVFETTASLIDQRDVPETIFMIDRERASAVVVRENVLRRDNPMLSEIMDALNTFEVVVPEAYLTKLMAPSAAASADYRELKMAGTLLIVLARSNPAAAEPKIQAALASTNDTVALDAAEALCVLKDIPNVHSRVFEGWPRLALKSFPSLKEPSPPWKCSSVKSTTAD